ncbi:MAG: UDP-N-acetylmuramate dehydrogenase [Eubacteriales bacterium]|nr:UDP-N-acetylmuramate dehydrogenase [Eubacteriales bacterium]
MNINAVSKALSEAIEDVRVRESMADHTSFKVGGDADVMVVPKSNKEIMHAVIIADSFGAPLSVMGKGTNLLVTSKGIRGVVLKLADNFSGMVFDGDCVSVKSGTPLAALVREAASHSLGGIEFLGGIPGTLGGAVTMNAGAYGGEIGGFVQEVYLVSKDGAAMLGHDEMGFGYRKSVLSEKPLIVTGAVLRLKKCDAEKSKKRLSELNGKRREKQPLEYPSAGSTFKRPEGHYAGALIEQAGLKGFGIGGAQVSEKHAGFIVNRGGATPEDIIALIVEVQRRVLQNSSVMLEPEVKIIGER